jgi:hypothetical protein
MIDLTGGALPADSFSWSTLPARRPPKPLPVVPGATGAALLEPPSVVFPRATLPARATGGRLGRFQTDHQEF